MVKRLGKLVGFRSVGRRTLKRALLGAVALAVLGAGTWAGTEYWRSWRFEVATDDAYVQADHTTVAPKVSGYIAEVAVEDNKEVKAGQVLARIDDRDFRTALAQAQADVATAEADIANIDAQLVLQRALIQQAQADIAAQEAQLKFAQQDDARYRELMKTGYGTVQRAQQAEASLRQNAASLQRQRAGLTAAQDQIKVLQSQRAKAATQVDRNKAIARQAQLNLDYTTIAAPIDGMVGARTVRAGQFVQAGTQLMAVVPLEAVYVVANYKETQLANVRPGSPAEVEVDAFPGLVIEGRVDSIAPASGQQFALLPPDNATGNFTKIVQRVPVKIVLDPGNPLVGRIRPGMSVEPVIDTRPGRVARDFVAAKPTTRADRSAEQLAGRS